MKEFKNILIINFGGIGDEIFFLPTLISLKKAFPSSKITLALEPRSKGIKDLTEVIDDLFLTDIKYKNKYFELLKLIFKARKRNFDLVISSGSNKFISILLFLTGIKTRIGYDTGKLSKFLLTNVISLNKKQYACKMYHDLISKITNEKTELPQINIEKQEIEKNTVLIHPGVSKLSIKNGCIKTISAKKWAEIIDLLTENGKQVVLAGGPDDKEVIETILKTVKTNQLTNTFGQTKNLKDLARLIAKSEIFLCSDSAPLHIAVALKTKTYAIFGATDEKVLIPQLNFVTAIFNEKCSCRPCLWEKRLTTCNDLTCLDISAEEIVKKVLS